MAAGRLTVVFAGGGTGGHLYPALAIADELRRRVPDAAITFIGTKDKIEASVVPQRGYGFVSIWISGLRRSLRVSNLLFPLKVVVALMQSFFIIKKMNPQVVVGTGGYVCGPPLYAATLLGVPTVMQEQNSYPGATTRRLAARVNEMHISFDNTRTYLHRTDNVRLSGNPTQGSLGAITRSAGAEHFSLRPDLKTLLVFGGSLGAASINTETANILPALSDTGVQVIWQTGKTDFERIAATVQRTLDEPARKRVRVQQFIERMEFAYAAADLALCRAGASTLAELTVAGLPSVLVPYPFAAADHQTGNARALVEKGAAVMIRDSELPGRLLGTLQELLQDDARRKQMSARAKELGRPEAAATIAEAVIRLAGG